MPSAAALRISATGKCLASSQAIAFGANTSSANARAMSRTASLIRVERELRRRAPEDWSSIVPSRPRRSRRTSLRSACAARATARDRDATMPIAMAMTKTITPGDSVARFAIAGPGHKPTRPQPMPNSAAPMSSGRSIAVAVGQRIWRVEDRRARPHQRVADAGDGETCRHHHGEARVPGAARNAEDIEEAQNLCRLIPSARSPGPGRK